MLEVALSDVAVDHLIIVPALVFDSVIHKELRHRLVLGVDRLLDVVQLDLVLGKRPVHGGCLNEVTVHGSASSRSTALGIWTVPNVQLLVVPNVPLFLELVHVDDVCVSVLADEHEETFDLPLLQEHTHLVERIVELELADSLATARVDLDTE